IGQNTVAGFPILLGGTYRTAGVGSEVLGELWGSAYTRAYTRPEKIRGHMGPAGSTSKMGTISLALWRKDVGMTCVKTLPKMDISDELHAQIDESIKLSDLCKADVVRQAL